ncbi:hypothetical protein FRC03_009569 [Tulasnella sp. 419]|nr:hypothetical protein FRC02_009030 [Tulasnella sp. 418]KAG8957978.1 hypothetical protein FRC03_009569 [Tulasnella sp. 419]
MAPTTAASLRANATLRIHSGTEIVVNSSRFTSYTASLSPEPRCPSENSLNFRINIAETRDRSPLPDGSVIQFITECKILRDSSDDFHLVVEIQDVDVRVLSQVTENQVSRCSFRIRGNIHRRAHNAQRILTLELERCVFVSATLEGFTEHIDKLLIGEWVTVAAKFHSLSRTSDNSRTLIIFRTHKIKFPDKSVAILRFNLQARSPRPNQKKRFSSASTSSSGGAIASRISEKIYMTPRSGGMPADQQDCIKRTSRNRGNKGALGCETSSKEHEASSAGKTINSATSASFDPVLA